MTPAARSILLAFIVLAGFCARAATYRAPLLDHHGWRQADTASIARNFSRERFNILYPQVDQRGAGAEGYVTTGLELFAFLVAAIAALTGFHTEIGRVLSACFFIVSCLLVARFVRRRHGDEAGVVAAFLYAFGFPLLLFIERAFMNEAMLICLSLGCLATVQRHVERPSAATATGLVLTSSLIAVIKLPYLIVWAPVFGLFLEADGARVWRRGVLWTMAIVNVAAAGLWYTHAQQLGASTGLSFGLTDKLFDAGTVFSVEYPLRLLDRLLRDILSPVGLIAVAIGTWLAVGRRQWCELFGVFGFAAYVVLVGIGNYHHNYYQLALMPVAAIAAAPGTLWVAEMLSARTGATREKALAGLLALAAISTFVRLVSAHSWFEYTAHDVVLCEALGKATQPDDRLLFVGDNNPQLLFCADRRGWLLSEAESTGARVREAWQQGATLAIVRRTLTRADVRQVTADWGPPVLESPAFEVYRLPP